MAFIGGDNPFTPSAPAGPRRRPVSYEDIVNNPYFIPDYEVPGEPSRTTTNPTGNTGIDSPVNPVNGGGGRLVSGGGGDDTTEEDVFTVPDEVYQIPQTLTYEEAIELGIITANDEDYQQYAGTGIPLISAVIGPDDEVIKWSIVPQASELYGLKNIEFPDFQSWLTENSDLGNWQDPSGVIGQLGGLAELLEEAGTVGSEQYNEDLAAQLEYAAQQAGFDSAEEYQQWLTDYRNTGISDMEGLSGTQKDAYDRAFAQEINMIREDNQRMIEAIGIQSTGRAFQAMNESISQIANQQLQQDMYVMQQDQLQRQLEYEAFSQRATQLMDVHSQEKQFLADQMYQNRMGALEAYATQLNGIITSNQQLLSAYDADMRAIQANANTMYNTIMAQIGVDESLLNQSAEEYNMNIAPWLAEVETYMLENEVEDDGGFLAFLAELGIKVATSIIAA